MHPGFIKFSTSATCSASTLPFSCHPRTQTELDLACDERTDIPKLVLSLLHCPVELFLKSLSQSNPAKGCPYKFLSRETTMTMTMTHPNEVSTRVNLALRTRTGGRDPNKKNMLMLCKACRGRVCGQFLLKDKWFSHWGATKYGRLCAATNS